MKNSLFKKIAHHLLYRPFYRGFSSTQAFDGGPVHANAFSLENSYISMGLGLPSTPIRWAFSLKTHRFENALESGSKWKGIHIVLVTWTVSNASKWKRWPKISQACVFVACAYHESSTYVTMSNSIVFEHFSVDSRKCIKMVVWTRLDRCVFDY